MDYKRYLFFDIECCNGRDICEFGYVITDTDYNVLEKEDVTINPEKPFNLTGRPNQRDLKLYYSESVYYKSYKFPFFYEKIKKIIEEPNQIIVGHAISNDAGFLRTACQRYNLAPINFKFADSQKMFAEYFNVRKSISLEDAGDEFKVNAPKYLHKSDEDSQLTMGLVKSMAESLECSLEELIDLCDSCSGKSENFEISYDDAEKRLKRMYARAQTDPTNLVRKGNYKLFLLFLDGVKPQGEIKKTRLTGKSLCISMNYEYSHFREMLAIIQLLTNQGAHYKMKASLSDIFVSYLEKDETGEDRYCSRLKYVNEAIQEGEKIAIITFHDLLDILGVEESDLKEYPFPKESFFVKKQKPKGKQDSKLRDYKESSSGISLGELLKAKGVDINNL